MPQAEAVLGIRDIAVGVGRSTHREPYIEPEPPSFGRKVLLERVCASSTT